MTDFPKADVTVVNPTFNCARFLPEALAPILGHMMHPARVVVDDDGSTDEVEFLMRRLMPSVKYIRRAKGSTAKALVIMMPSILAEHAWFFDYDHPAHRQRRMFC